MASQLMLKEITSEFQNNITDYMFASKLLKAQYEIKFFIRGMIFFNYHLINNHLILFWKHILKLIINL